MTRNFASLLTRFRHAAQGTVAIIGALATVPMFAAAGVALDFIHASAIHSRLQSALDGAALAAAASPTLSKAERIAIAKDLFARNFADPLTDGIEAVPRFQVTGSGSVRASAEIEVPTSLMRVVGIDTVGIDAEVEVAIPEEKRAEVVLVLDYSGSMREAIGGKVKYLEMKNAAKGLVAALKAAGKDRVKIGVVPFSHHVWVTLPKAFVRGETGAGSWTGCTQDREYPFNTLDSTPSAEIATQWGTKFQFDPSEPGKRKSCAAYLPNGLVVRPLTDDFDAVSAQLDAMEPYDYTHIALGVEFGWHVLSPNAPFTEGASYSDDDTQKILVVLTDGKQTELGYGADGSRTKANAARNLEQLCANMKDEDITIMSIAYDLDDTTTRTRLKNCSTDPEKHFFIADDTGDIAAAFDQIKTQITAQLYLSK